MRLYTLDDEVRIRTSRELRDWTAAGLLSADQDATLRADLATALRGTGLMLRLGLAAFTVVAGSAALGLVVMAADLTSEVAMTITTAVLASAAMAAATWLVRAHRLYRHGVEEALAMGAVVLFGVSAGVLAIAIAGTSADGAAWCCGMAAVAGASLFAYRRFGFQYAAVAALYAVALAPAAFQVVDRELARVFGAVICATAFVYATHWRRDADDAITHSDAETVRAAAAIGAYGAVNVFLTGAWFSRSSVAGFTWTMWVLTWAMPFVAGRAAIVERDPRLLRVAMAMTLVSLVTNKSYLGWSRHPWDPMLLGVLLVGVALGLRRWLSSGPDGERHGYTARQLAESDSAAIQVAGLASAALQPAHERQVPAEPDSTFSGGRSGGAGASSGF